MRPIGPDIINEIFEALDRQIGVHGGVPLGIVVCGGTALFALVLRKVFKALLKDFLEIHNYGDIAKRI